MPSAQWCCLSIDIIEWRDHAYGCSQDQAQYNCTPSYGVFYLIHMIFSQVIVHNSILRFFSLFCRSDYPSDGFCTTVTGFVKSLLADASNERHTNSCFLKSCRKVLLSRRQEFTSPVFRFMVTFISRNPELSLEGAKCISTRCIIPKSKGANQTFMFKLRHDILQQRS